MKNFKIHMSHFDFHWNTVVVLLQTDSFVFISTADDEHWVYADGIEIGHGVLATPLMSTILDGTRLIAVKAVDFNNYAGFIGSSSNGIVTDSSWKCTRDLVTDWEKLNFDDSKWSAPTATRSNGDPLVKDVASNAKWLWSGAYNDAKTTVYCRKRLGKFCILITTLDYTTTF